MTTEIADWRRSPALKAAVVALLSLLLLIPLAMVAGLIAEREGTRSFAEREVSGKWGGRQDLGGPVLIIPYRYQVQDSQGKVAVHTSYCSFLPETLSIEGELTPEIRFRGIYEVALYKARLRVSGAFGPPDFSEWRIPAGDVIWDDALLSFGIPDLRGIQDSIQLTWDGAALPFHPGAGVSSLFPSGIHAPVPGLERGGVSHPFEFHLNLNGSQALTFEPLGRETRATLASRWTSPSFTGAFLPAERTIREDGFAADWRIFYLGRPYPQKWRAAQVDSQALAKSASGVELRLPVDAYQKTTRSAKYGILFVSLTFGVFFLFEILARLRIHPFQYLLVGFALCLFYLLLLSMSEHIGFDRSYAAASAATLGLITTYSWSVLKGGRRVLLTAGSLAGLYGYLYVLLRLDDYALLLGSIGLFLILAAVMALTRKVDWYVIGREADGA